MENRIIKRVLILMYIFIGISVFSIAQTIKPIKSIPYEWKSVPIVGGGFVDGIVFHPSQPDICYCRTDMGGAYKWNASTKSWMPLMDWVSLDDSNLQGVKSIAIDPQNADNVYLACGTYTTNSNAAILCSYDGARTFTRIDVPFTMGGNENGRGNGERMMVDPQNGNIIYIGTRQNGLWRSVDKGKSWKKVTTFPDVTEPFNPADRSESAQFNLNLKIENIELLMGDELNLVNGNTGFSVEMPPISYALYKLSL